MNKCYIQSMAQVSCQQPLCDDWLDNPVQPADGYVRAVEPLTKGLIAPGEARRMSRILRRAVATSLTALRESGIDMPDAIVTGTGMGCMENSEKFLTDLCEFGESCLKPTLFMQSTHNTIGSLVAMQLKCHGYNNTYSQLDASFESALFDAWLQLRLGYIGNALVGAHDEVTPLTAKLLRAVRPDYATIGEASVSVVVGSRPSPVEIEEVCLLYRPDEAGLDGITAWEPDGADIWGYCPSASALRFYQAVRLLESGRIDRDSLTLVNRCPDGTVTLIKLRRCCD